MKQTSVRDPLKGHTINRDHYRLHLYKVDAMATDVLRSSLKAIFTQLRVSSTDKAISSILRMKEEKELFPSLEKFAIMVRASLMEGRPVIPGEISLFSPDETCTLSTSS